MSLGDSIFNIIYLLTYLRIKFGNLSSNLNK